MERTTVSIKLEGMTELVAAMRRLPVEVRERKLEDAVKAGAQIVAQAVSERASGAFQSRSGKLLRAIRQGVSLAQQSLIRTRVRSPEEVLVEVWPRVPYAHLIEGGHRIIARGGGREGIFAERLRGRGGRFVALSGTSRRAQLRRALLARRGAGAIGQVAARPFVGPAYEATKDQAAEVIMETLWRNIERAWTGTGGR